MTMINGADVFTITIRKRAWWFWALAGLWLLLEILLLQTAVASAQEREYRAATISWMLVGLLATLGCFAWLRRRGPHKHSNLSEQHREATTSEPTSISTAN
jgi:Na+/melibiose symporter-like transporter